MADYKRFVSYIYNYEFNMKKNNVGYVRVESKNGQCKITVHIKVLTMNEHRIPIYFFHRNKETYECIWIGTMVPRNGVGEFQALTETANIMKTGYSLDDMGGMILYVSEEKFFGTEWDDIPICLHEFQVVEEKGKIRKEEGKNKINEQRLDNQQSKTQQLRGQIYIEDNRRDINKNENNKRESQKISAAELAISVEGKQKNNSADVIRMGSYNKADNNIEAENIIKIEKAIPLSNLELFHGQIKQENESRLEQKRENLQEIKGKIEGVKTKIQEGAKSKVLSIEEETRRRAETFKELNNMFKQIKMATAKKDKSLLESEKSIDKASEPFILPEQAEESKDLSRLPEQSEASRNLSRPPEHPEASRNLSRLPEQPEVSRNLSRPLEHPEASRNLSRLPEQPETAKNLSRLPEQPETARNLSRLSEQPETAKDLFRLPEQPELSSLSNQKEMSKELSNLSGQPETLKETSNLSNQAKVLKNLSNMLGQPEALKDPSSLLNQISSIKEKFDLSNGISPIDEIQPVNGDGGLTEQGFLEQWTNLINNKKEEGVSQKLIKEEGRETEIVLQQENTNKPTENEDNVSSAMISNKRETTLSDVIAEIAREAMLGNQEENKRNTAALQESIQEKTMDISEVKEEQSKDSFSKKFYTSMPNEISMLQETAEKIEMDAVSEREKIEESAKTAKVIQMKTQSKEEDRVMKMFIQYPKIYPFEDDEILECVRIEPQDIGVFPMAVWNLANNSFLLHGYYSYRHLIFAKQKKNGKIRYIVGIPGIYQNREKFMAQMFGFHDFKTVKRKEQKTGEFGYWLTPIKIQ